MTNYRFSLDDQIDADFIAFIREKSNGGSENKAMKLFCQNQYAIYLDRNTTPTRQKTVLDVSNEVEMVDSQEINLSGSDGILSEE